MGRLKAVLAVGLGLALIGVALGLLYMDVREHAAVQMMIEAKGGGEAEKKAAAVQAWQNNTRVSKALVAGASGAALLGMGVMLGVLELRAVRRGPQ